MKKIFCDLCGKEIQDIKNGYSHMAFHDGRNLEEKHLHIECAVRVGNFLNRYFHAVSNGNRVELKWSEEVDDGK